MTNKYSDIKSDIECEDHQRILNRLRIEAIVKNDNWDDTLTNKWWMMVYIKDMRYEMNMSSEHV